MLHNVIYMLGRRHASTDNLDVEIFSLNKHAECQTDAVVLSCASDSSTPKAELRERIYILKSEQNLQEYEYKELEHFTRLEKNIFEELESKASQLQEENGLLKEELNSERKRTSQLEEVLQQRDEIWAIATENSKELERLSEENAEIKTRLAEKETALKLLEEKLLSMNTKLEKSEIAIAEKDQVLLENVALLESVVSEGFQEQISPSNEEKQIVEYLSLLKEKEQRIIELERQIECMISERSLTELKYTS